MNTYDYLEELKTFISLCTDEDLIYVLHIFNKNEVDYNSRRARGRSRDLEYLKADIDCLNSLNNLKDIKKLVIKNYEKYNNHEIRNFLDDLKKFKSKIETTNIDFTKVKNNARFLNFACYLINEKAGGRELENFKSKYFNFLYVALTYPEFYSSPRDIERIFSNFSDIYSKYPSHFKNDQDRYFYI